MLEIIGIVFLAKKLAAMAQEKGRTKAWGALGPVFWLTAEITGFIVGLVLGLGQIGYYMLGLGSAVMGGLVAFAIVAILPDAGSFPAPAARGGLTPCPSCGSTEAKISGRWILCSACHTRSPLAGP